MLMSLSLALLALILIVPSSTSLQTKVLNFNGGGIYYWWQAGACKYLNEAGFQSMDIKVSGESAGSLSASNLVCDCDFDYAAELAISLCEREDLFNAPTGLAFKWGPIVEEWLYDLLPASLDDGSSRSRKKLSRLLIKATPLSSLMPFGTREVKIFKDFRSKEELIDGLMCSAHIPFFLDTKLYRKMRHEGHNYGHFIDGSFWNFVSKGDFYSPIPLNMIDPTADAKALVREEEIFTIDWQRDVEFSSKLEQSSFVSLITPQTLYDFLDAGYEFTKKQHKNSMIPAAVLPTSKSKAMYPSIVKL